MRFGINLFGVWKELEKDPQTFCKKISEYGYRYIEPCVAIQDRNEAVPQFIGEETLAELIRTANAEGIQVESIFVSASDEANAGVRMKELAEKYGIRQFIYGCPGEYTKEVYEAYALRLLSWADCLEGTGAEILLHNGGPDIAAKIDGISAYEWLLRRCGGRIFAEPDVGWMMYGAGDGKGGDDPEAFLWRNKEYIHVVHYKDFAENADGTWRHCEIGTGVVDMTAVFQFARAAEVVQYADQDVFADMMGELKAVCHRLQQLQDVRDNSRSILCVFDTETGEKKTLRTFDRVIEAPNWMKDGDTLIYNSDGHIFRYSISRDEETMVDTGICDKCNNDHVLSPDEKEIAVSHFDENFVSAVYRIPLDGGEPVRVTGGMHSFLHGWSPDKEELAFCGFRLKKGVDAANVGWPEIMKLLAVDVISIPADGGEERNLTGNIGFNDGPEYAPDGKKIWFISTRSGLMQVWKMDRDGGNPEQMTFEEQNNWFGHISPDGKKVVNIAYSKDGLDPNQHLPNMDVSLWLMKEDGSDRRKILDFFGGQGSINVNSWAPDSRRFAYVEYELLHK